MNSIKYTTGEYSNDINSCASAQQGVRGQGDLHRPNDRNRKNALFVAVLTAGIIFRDSEVVNFRTKSTSTFAEK